MQNSSTGGLTYSKPGRTLLMGQVPKVILVVYSRTVSRLRSNGTVASSRLSGFGSAYLSGILPARTDIQSLVSVRGRGLRHGSTPCVEGRRVFLFPVAPLVCFKANSGV